MIGLLEGKIAHKAGDLLVVNVGGVGYEVTCTATAISNARSVGDKIKLVIYTDVRENAISLFGFHERVEKEVFLLLKKVKGIGSKVALSIISSIRPEVLLSSIGQGNVSLLQKVPGVGKKTAERLIVELREQVGELARDVAPLSARITKNLVPSVELGAYKHLPSAAIDAALALEKLGFPAERALEAVTQTVSSPGIAQEVLQDAGELTRLALSQLS